jgi:hypothetical protein
LRRRLRAAGWSSDPAASVTGACWDVGSLAEELSGAALAVVVERLLVRFAGVALS